MFKYHSVFLSKLYSRRIVLEIDFRAAVTVATCDQINWSLRITRDPMQKRRGLLEQNSI